MVISDSTQHDPRRAEVLEALVLLYLRLNGYFCIPNYLYHRVQDFGLRTESDVLGIRFPHQKEVLSEAEVSHLAENFLKHRRINFLNWPYKLLVLVLHPM